MESIDMTYDSLELPRSDYLETPLPLPQSLCGRTDGHRSYGDVITKFTRLDGLPKFLKNGCCAGAPVQNGGLTTQHDTENIASLS